MNDKTDDEADLFRQAMAGTRPLKSRRVPPAAPRPKARASFTREDEKRVLEESLDAVADAAFIETGEELVYRRPGLPAATFRKLRRGQFSVGAELDLHGMTSKTAREALNKFLRDCRREGQSCVRIIHGKGKGSGHGGPVLKPAINRWLRRHNPVQAFCTARPVDGGTGAIYVLLRHASA